MPHPVELVAYRILNKYIDFFLQMMVSYKHGKLCLAEAYIFLCLYINKKHLKA